MSVVRNVDPPQEGFLPTTARRQTRRSGLFSLKTRSSAVPPKRACIQLPASRIQVVPFGVVFRKSYLVCLPFLIAANAGRCFVCACYSPVRLWTSAVRNLSSNNPEEYHRDHSFHDLDCASFTSQWMPRADLACTCSSCLCTLGMHSR